MGRPHGDLQKEGRITDLPEKRDRQVGPDFGLKPHVDDRLGRVEEVGGPEVAVIALAGGPELEALPTGAGWDEAWLARAAIEVPLAEEAGPIAVAGEDLGERRLRLPEPEVVGDHPILVSVLTR